MIAARVAAQLAGDPALEVHRVKGGLGELRVAVDGVDAVNTSRLVYPAPSSIVRKVRAYLGGPGA